MFPPPVCFDALFRRCGRTPRNREIGAVGTESALRPFAGGKIETASDNGEGGIAAFTEPTGLFPEPDP